MNEWQPIETAPKDGTAILVVRSGKEKFPSYNVVYFKDDRSHCGKTYPWQFVEGSEAYHRNWPTHWMPLPEPPTMNTVRTSGDATTAEG